MVSGMFGVWYSRQVGQVVHPPLTPIPVAGPFDRVGVDVLHFPKSAAGNQYAVVFVNYLTKQPEVFATPDQSALTIAKLLVENVVCRHGVPAQLLSDRGAAFLSQLMKEVCEVVGVKKVNTTAYHPGSSNGSIGPSQVCWPRRCNRMIPTGTCTSHTFYLHIEPVSRNLLKNPHSFYFMVKIHDCHQLWTWRFLSCKIRLILTPTKES